MAQRSRVVAVVALLIVLAAALRGYLPGGETPQQDRPTSGLGSLFAVVAMLTVSMAIIAIAIITQARRRAPSSAGGPPRRELAGERRPVTWKMVLVGVGVLAAWLLLIALLSRWNLPIGVDQPAQNAATTPPTAGPQPPNRLDGPASGANVVPVLATAALLLREVWRAATGQLSEAELVMIKESEEQGELEALQAELARENAAGHGTSHSPLGDKPLPHAGR